MITWNLRDFNQDSEYFDRGGIHPDYRSHHEDDAHGISIKSKVITAKIPNYDIGGATWAPSSNASRRTKAILVDEHLCLSEMTLCLHLGNSTNYLHSASPLRAHLNLITIISWCRGHSMTLCRYCDPHRPSPNQPLTMNKSHQSYNQIGNTIHKNHIFGKLCATLHICHVSSASSCF